MSIHSLGIIELQNKFHLQMENNSQPEAFLTGWRLFHLTVRAYLINKLCDPPAMARLITSMPQSAIPSELERSTRLAPHVVQIESVEGYFLRQFAAKVNNAGESNLITKLAFEIAGVDLMMYWKRHTPVVYEGYSNAARFARHHVAHGKVFGQQKNFGKSYEELAEIMSWAIGSLHFAFGDDPYFQHVLLDGPLPVFSIHRINMNSNRLAISEDPDFLIPDYD